MGQRPSTSFALCLRMMYAQSGYLFTFLASDLGCVQLAHQIYGAVVDELTEDQVRNVVVPLPRTHRQRKLVANRSTKDCSRGAHAAVATLLES